MKKPDSLFILIKALSRSEKRYFKLFCTKEDRQGNYLKLFDAIDAQQVYDEAAIKKKFGNATFTRQLHVTKIYLYRLIMKVLRNFHEKVSQDAQVKDGLRNIEILFNKELYTHCQNEVASLEQTCQTYELHSAMIEVQNWKRKLRQNLQPFDYASFNAALAGQKKALELLKNVHDFWNLAINASQMDRGKTSELQTHPLLADKEQALSLEARVLYHNTSYVLNLLNDQSAVAKDHLIDLVNYLEKKPGRIAQEPGFYVSSINNLLSFLIYKREHKEALAFITKAKKVYTDWKVTSENRNLLKQILRTYNIELEVYRTQKKSRDLSKMVADVEETVHRYKNKMPKEYLLSFWFQLSSRHFMHGNFDRALQWVNQLLNAKFKQIRPDLHGQAQLLNLMIHFEQQNIFVLRYFVESARRVLKRNGPLQEYEKLLLTFFIKISRMPDAEHREAFKALKKVLFPINGESLVPEISPGSIHFKQWIENRSNK